MEDNDVARHTIWLASEWQRLRSDMSHFSGKESITCTVYKKVGQADPERPHWRIEFIGQDGSLDGEQLFLWQRQKASHFAQLASRGGVLLEATWPGYAVTKGSVVPWEFWGDELFDFPLGEFKWEPRVERFEMLLGDFYSNYVQCPIKNFVAASISKCLEFEAYALAGGFFQMCKTPATTSIRAESKSEWLKREMQYVKLDHNNMQQFGGPSRKTVLDLLAGKQGTNSSWIGVCEALSKRSRRTITLNDIPGYNLLPKSPKKSQA